MLDTPPPNFQRFESFPLYDLSKMFIVFIENKRLCFVFPSHLNRRHFLPFQKTRLVFAVSNGTIHTLHQQSFQIILGFVTPFSKTFYLSPATRVFKVLRSISRNFQIIWFHTLSSLKHFVRGQSRAKGVTLALNFNFIFHVHVIDVFYEMLLSQQYSYERKVWGTWVFKELHN